MTAYILECQCSYQGEIIGTPKYCPKCESENINLSPVPAHKCDKCGCVVVDSIEAPSGTLETFGGWACPECSTIHTFADRLTVAELARRVG